MMHPATVVETIHVTQGETMKHLSKLVEAGTDVVKMDVPLFIRMLELAREDLKSDEDLHKVVSNALDAGDRVLTMADYDAIAKI